MPASDRLARLNRRYFNHVFGAFAGTLPPFAMIEHRGRKSGRRYQIPIIAFPDATGTTIALTYGPDRDWVRNVLAAGGAAIEQRGRIRSYDHPRLVHGDAGMRAVLPPLRPILRRLDVVDFLRFDAVSEAKGRSPGDAADASANGDRPDRDALHCCIAGGGPAGAMLALLLARAGLNVRLLEKHGDFLRDFRGDTIHPSTLELLDQLGLAERFLRLPHSEITSAQLPSPAGSPIVFTFRRLKTRFPFIAFVPQWDFLDFITGEAARYPGFRLEMNAEVLDLIEEDGRVCGVRYRTPGGEREARALLTVGADGRSSRTRELAGLRVIETSAPIDVLWFRLSRRPDEPAALVARAGRGGFAALIDRRAYWQIAYLIPKGAFAAIHAAGLDAFRRAVAALVPDVADRVDELRDWEQVKLLTVRSNRLARWFRPGYLAIGDAAHAMSPIGGVGINLAIQDAVVAANFLWRPLRDGWVAPEDLAKVQERRELPVRLVQAAQAFVQRRVMLPALGSSRTPAFPWPVRLLPRIPLLRDLPARLIGFGVGRPRIESPALAETSTQYSVPSTQNVRRSR